MRTPGIFIMNTLGILMIKTLGVFIMKPLGFFKNLCEINAIFSRNVDLTGKILIFHRNCDLVLVFISKVFSL